MTAPRISLRHPYVVTIGIQTYRLQPSGAHVLFALMMTRECSLEVLAEAVWPGETLRPMDVRARLGNYIYDLRQILRGHWRIKNRFDRGWTLEREE